MKAVKVEEPSGTSTKNTPEKVPPEDKKLEKKKPQDAKKPSKRAPGDKEETSKPKKAKVAEKPANETGEKEDPPI